MVRRSGRVGGRSLSFGFSFLFFFCFVLFLIKNKLGPCI